MFIPLKRDGDIEEWGMIELQGDLNFESTETINQKYIGDLHFTRSGAPIFIIGIHILHGKEVPLPKPLAVLEKRCNEAQNESLMDSSDAKSQYIVKAIVRKKLVFRTRPKPIIMHVPKSN